MELLRIGLALFVERVEEEVEQASCEDGGEVRPRFNFVLLQQAVDANGGGRLRASEEKLSERVSESDESCVVFMDVNFFELGNIEDRLEVEIGFKLREFLEEFGFIQESFL